MIKTTYPPSILQYIPFFFVIWSDDLLTLSEIAVVKKIIHEDQNLSNKDRETLNNWLNTVQPPLDTEIKSWQRAIANSGIKLVESDNHPLTSFSKKLISQNGSEHIFNENLSAIEVNLGIQPNHYHHLFEVEVVLEKTSHFYDPKEIDQIIKCTCHRE
ncbi:MAG: acyl-CoA oxidase, partial [Arenibacter sp.]